MPCPECNTENPPKMPPGFVITLDDKGVTEARVGLSWQSTHLAREDKTPPRRNHYPPRSPTPEWGGTHSSWHTSL